MATFMRRDEAQFGEVSMRSTTLVKAIGTGMLVCGLMLSQPFAVAQESPPAQQKKSASTELQERNEQVITEFRANQGKVGGRYANSPLLLLTTKGAKSGRALTRPLAYSKDGERLVVIASFGGGPKNPPWFHNLVANPEVTVEVGSERFQAKATVAAGEERQRLYNQQAAQLPAFAEYAKKTTRQIPVIVLTRMK